LTREQRRLAAIVAADVVGYSRLMGRDESGTLAALKALRREVVDPPIAAHGGRIVKTTGDGLLLEFPSVVDAVRCVVEIQTALAERSAAIADDKRIAFRVGVNLGDIIIDGDDIFGDGVNIAARLEGIAEPGGICLSDDAYRQIRGKFDLMFDDLGLQTLKNIVQPVHAWRLRLGDERAQSSAATSALPLSDKPSIAVLPFENMSGDPEQEYFADGMVEDIITALSRFKSLFVIARNSSFTYKGRAVDVRQVGRELGVRYVLEGSVRKAGNRLRLTGQLVEALSGIHVWADRFDGALDDMFELQDRITSSIVVAMLPTLEQAEIERSRRKPTGSLAAYDYYLRGRAQYSKFTHEANEQAIALFRKASELDPEWALPLAILAESIKRRIEWGWSTRIAEELREAATIARQAIALDKSDPQALTLAGTVLTLVAGEEGVALLDRAIALNPNNFSAWNWRGWAALILGEKDAARYFESALHLSPAFQGRYLIQNGLAAAHVLNGRYDEAVALVAGVLREHPNLHIALWIHAAALALAGRVDEARVACKNLVSVVPAMRLSNAGDWVMTRDKETLELIKRGLRLAGLPE
jgi:TolB-like protein/Flp pilus assembly protein TadD